jgi:signal transduction histidine kinase
MNYRAREIGATLQIRSDNGKGAILTCLFNRAL